MKASYAEAATSKLTRETLDRGRAGDHCTRRPAGDDRSGRTAAPRPDRVRGRRRHALLRGRPQAEALANAAPDRERSRPPGRDDPRRPLQRGLERVVVDPASRPRPGARRRRRTRARARAAAGEVPAVPRRAARRAGARSRRQRGPRLERLGLVQWQAEVERRPETRCGLSPPDAVATWIRDRVLARVVDGRAPRSAALPEDRERAAA